jgi:hypothetical protein
MRKGKRPRLCIDARKINQFMIPDRERTPPLHELLRVPYGFKNSLPAFVRALELMLGPETERFIGFVCE